MFNQFVKININLQKLLVLFFIVSMVILSAPPVYAAKKSDLLKQQNRLNSDIGKLQLRLIKDANNSQEIEAKTIRIEERIGLLMSQEHQQRKVILKDNKNLGDTLSAMIQISNRPDRLFLVYPGDGLSAARSHLLISYVTPRLQNRIFDINSEILALTETQKKLQGEKILLFETKEDLAEHTIRITRLVENKQKLLKVNKETLKKLADETKKLKKQSRTVTELVKKASTTKSTAAAGRLKKPKTIRTFPSKGKITLPSKGKIIRGFGQKTTFGARSRGILLSTRSRSQIVASFDGKIVFSGEFQNLGKMLIIEHRGDYHTVISGLDVIYAKRGQWVLQGEPIGKMPRNNPKLYVELRKNGQHINPKRWFS